MWWYCGYEALPGGHAGDLARRFLQAHDAGTNRPGELRGWFAFPSGVAGFVMIEVDTPKEVARILSPYSRLVSWRVEAITEVNYNQMLEELRRSAQHEAVEDMMAGVAPVSN